MNQTIIKPTDKHNNPVNLRFLFFVRSIIFTIFFILDGKMAITKPSIKRSNPIAIIRSLINNYCFLINPALPKNLKKSLSGDKINDVSPPINAFSYDCIAL